MEKAVAPEQVRAIFPKFPDARLVRTHARWRKRRRSCSPGGWLYDLETLAGVFATPTMEGKARRLFLLELIDSFQRAGLRDVECVYRFRDRAIVRGRV